VNDQHSKKVKEFGRVKCSADEVENDVNYGNEIIREGDGKENQLQDILQKLCLYYVEKNVGKLEQQCGV
jgi:hypothetical protein